MTFLAASAPDGPGETASSVLTISVWHEQLLKLEIRNVNYTGPYSPLNFRSAHLGKCSA